jgi:hypothetical protein
MLIHAASSLMMSRATRFHWNPAGFVEATIGSNHWRPRTVATQVEVKTAATRIAELRAEARITRPSTHLVLHHVPGHSRHWCWCIGCWWRRCRLLLRGSQRYPPAAISIVVAIRGTPCAIGFRVPSPLALDRTTHPLPITYSRIRQKPTPTLEQGRFFLTATITIAEHHPVQVWVISDEQRRVISHKRCRAVAESVAEANHWRTKARASGIHSSSSSPPRSANALSKKKPRKLRNKERPYHPRQRPRRVVQAVAATEEEANAWRAMALEAFFTETLRKVLGAGTPSRSGAEKGGRDPQPGLGTGSAVPMGWASR